MVKKRSQRVKADKKKVFIVGNFLSSHGLTPQVCETLSIAFRGEDWEVLTSSDKQSKAARMFDIVSSLIMNKNRYDLLIVDTFAGPGFWFATAAAKTASFLKKPYVLNLHGGNLPDFFRKNVQNISASIRQLLFPHPLYRRATLINYRDILEHAARLVSPSPYLSHEISALGFPVTEIPNSIETQRYDFRIRTKPRPKLLWLRSFSHIYNPALAIKVLAKLKIRYPDARLTMAGPDKGELARCKKYASELNVNNSVSFPGLVSKEEINRLGQIHDIFINTTNADNTPVSVIEAMTMGLPVVSTNVGGMPYLLENEETGLLVNPDSVDEMSLAVMKLLTDSPLAHWLSENARKKALSYAWENVFPLWKYLASDIPEKQ